MKNSIFKGLLLTSLLIVAAGCGKDGGGGGSSSNNLGTPNPGLGADSQTNFNSLASWYNAAEPATLRGYRKYSRTLTAPNSGNPTNCPGEIKKILGFEICVYSSSSSASTPTNGSYVDYLVGVNTNNNYTNPLSCVATRNNYGQYSCTQAAVPYVGKGSNVALQAALKNTQGLNLLSVTRISSTIYQLSYSNSTLETTPVLTYKIDTSLHSIYNPVETVDLRSLAQEYIAF